MIGQATLAQQAKEPNCGTWWCTAHTGPYRKGPCRRGTGIAFPASSALHLHVTEEPDGRRHAAVSILVDGQWRLPVPLSDTDLQQLESGAGKALRFLAEGPAR